MARANKSSRGGGFDKIVLQSIRQCRWESEE